MILKILLKMVSNLVPSWSYLTLTSIFSTYTGQFITVTGIPSSGKSDFVDQMVVGYNKEYGWKTAFASPENAPIYLHAHKLMRKTWGDMPSPDDIGGGTWNQNFRSC